jgi:aminoglycoside phosphotransferase family enzyme/predicted kinase
MYMDHVGQGGIAADERRPEIAGLPPFIRALMRPEVYPHPADDLRVHETHISWVILAGPYAYKMKKHVNLGFLDFSSIERRRADCDAEVWLNRRLCPRVYRGVVDVVERDGAYRIGGPGHIVEPAVWMRRLPEDGMFPRLLARDAVDAALVRRIARVLARFHAAAATGPGVEEWGTVAAIRANWEENFAQTAPFVGRTIPAAFQDRIATFVADVLTTRAPLLAERVAAGRIRDGHGDLHSANICVEGRTLHLFDCLEFSPRYRCADVAAEVAFLAMDLDRYGRADLAAVFVAEYLRASGDDHLRDLLPFYRSYRAYVRGKVLSLGLNDPAHTADARAEATRQARRYFDLAWSYAGGIAHPFMIVTMGMPATGKTTLAHALATRLGLVHLSSDRVRKDLAGIAPTARHTGSYQAGLYRPAMTRRTYAALHRRAGRWLRRGQSVVLDATYGDPAGRAAAVQLARRTGVRLAVFVCEADEATIRARLAARAADPNTVSDARLTLWPALRDAFVDPAELRHAVRLDMRQPEADVLEFALHHLA